LAVLFGPSSSILKVLDWTVTWRLFNRFVAVKLRLRGGYVTVNWRLSDGYPAVTYVSVPFFFSASIKWRRLVPAPAWGFGPTPDAVGLMAHSIIIGTAVEGLLL